MKQHIMFMTAFLSGLRSLPNPDLATKAYIRAFEMCLYSAKRHESDELSNHGANIGWSDSLLDSRSNL